MQGTLIAGKCVNDKVYEETAAVCDVCKVIICLDFFYEAVKKLGVQMFLCCS